MTGILWAVLQDKPIITPRHQNIYLHHVTLAYDVHQQEYADLIGEEIQIWVLGEYWNDYVQALYVTNKKGRAWDNTIISCANKCPHITVSCADDIPPVSANGMLESQTRNYKPYAYNYLSINCRIEFMEFTDREEFDQLTTANIS